jgi:hypothetical protein
MKWAIMTGIIGFLWVSCQREIDFSRELSSIDHFISVLEITQAEISAADTLGYRVDDEKIAGNIREITSVFNHPGDTMPGDIARLLAKYQNQLTREIVNTKKQLLDLRHDIEHNLLDEETVKDSYSRELIATEKVISEAGNWLELFNLKAQSDAGTEKEIDSLVTALKDIP